MSTEERKRKRRKGVTLIEVLGVVAVIAIISAAVGTSVTKSVKRTNREAAVNELQIYSTSLSDAYYDLGSPSYDPNDPESLEQFKRYLSTLESEYLGVTFNLDTLTATSTGFKLESSSPQDVFGNNYQFWFVTSDTVKKYVMVVSGGEDGAIGADTYSTQGYGDDIVLIVLPKS